MRTADRGSGTGVRATLIAAPAVRIAVCAVSIGFDCYGMEGLEKKGGVWQHAPPGTTGYLVVSGDESVGAAVSGDGGGGRGFGFLGRPAVRSGWIPNSTSASLR